MYSVKIRTACSYVEVCRLPGGFFINESERIIKTDMKTEKIKQFYESPDIRAYEMQIHTVICQSGNLGEMEHGDGSWLTE